MSYSSLAKVFSDGNLSRCRSLLKDAFVPLKRSQKSEVVQRQAAVLIPFCLFHNKPSVVFVRRPLWMRKHAGEIAFPGGGVEEPKDTSLAAAAVRECNEELGINISMSTILGALPLTLPNRDSSFLVTGVVGYIGAVDRLDSHLFPETTGRCHTLRPHRGEVDDVYIVSIEQLLANQKYVKFRVNSKSGTVRHWIGPCYPVKSTETNPPTSIQIWGLTGFMMREALKVLLPPTDERTV